MCNTKSIKLIISDHGDPSVGIFGCSWEVEYPMILDPENLSVDDKVELDFFRKDMIVAYQNYCDGRCTADYDFELKNDKL